MASIKRNQKIEDKDISPVPEYNKSLSGNAYLSRSDNAREVKANLFKIARKPSGDAVLSFNVTFNSNIGTLTVRHNLGYRPLVIGTLKVPTGEAILLPYTTGLDFAEVKSVTESEVTLGFRAEFATGYKVLLYLLRQPI
jgi:glutamine phosphoribosylpyrophosphate amidotransferase